MRQKILIDIGGTLTLKYYENDIQQIPTSALITIYDNGGAEKVAQTAAVVDATTGTMSYTVSDAIADEVYQSWKASWEFVVDGVTKYQSILFDIVRQVVSNPVIDADIINDAPFLKEQNYRKVFTADSGSTTTIISAELIEDDDYWNAGTVEVISGTNIGSIRKVTDFDDTSNKLTVEAFPSAIDNTSKCVVIRSYKKEIDRAFEKFKVDMKNRNIYIDRLIDNSQIKEYIIPLTLHYICMNMSKDIADIWLAKATAYKKDYNELINVAVFDYDADDDGNIEADEERDSLFQVSGER